MATEAGIKRHIAQSPAYREQWAKLHNWVKFTALDKVNDQPPEQTNDDVPDYPYEWGTHLMVQMVSTMFLMYRWTLGSSDSHGH